MLNLHNRCLPAALCFGLLVAPDLAAEPRTVYSQNEAAREHHLFVGAELLLRQGNELVPVTRIRGNEARLADPVNDYVSIRKSDGLIWRMTTKVAAVSGKIEDLTTSLSSSAELESFANQARLQAAMDDQASLIEQSQGSLMREAAQAEQLANSDDPTQQAIGEAQLAEIGTEMSALDDDMINVDAISEANDLNDINSPEGGQNDILELSFRVSSEVELPAAYVFVAVRVWANDRYFDTNFHRHLSNIGPKPRKVSFTRRGYPQGFEVKDTKVYLFSYGEEIPTNLSEKHYPLSYEEAKEFLQLSHMGEHRRETVAAQPAWSLVPPDILQTRDPATLDYPITVQLDETGTIVNFTSSDQVVPDHVKAVVQQLTFIPALENGKPVASTLTVNPADFFNE